MATVEIQLLGRFSARRAGEEIPPARFGGRLVRVLVRILVTRRGNFVPRDVLAEALWPDRLPADPTTNLRVLVQRARAALGDPNLIVTGPAGYSFAVGPGCVVDAELFVAAVQAGHDALARGQAGAALREFRLALDRWAGDPLAEDVYEDWARETTIALGRAHLQALEEGAAAALALRDPAQAVVLAERAVAREPLREPSALLLARALAASGDQVAALRAIAALRTRLGEDVGLELSAEALALETGLQRGEAVEAPRRPLVTSTRRGAFDGLSFVGREEELRAVLAAVAGAEPGAALVAGPGGTGKSRLLTEVAALSEVPVLAVRAFLPERNEPWSLARALLREALALDVDAAGVLPDRAAQALADVLPELEELRPIGAVAVDPESRRALALEAGALVMAAAAAKGLLVIVDDLQWADATSLAVLGVITRRVAQLGFIGAYRPDEVPFGSAPRHFVDDLRATRLVAEVTVGPFAPEAIALLVADEGVANAIAEATDSTPLAVAETVRGLSAELAIEVNARGRWEPRRPDAAERAREIAHSGQRRAIVARAERQPPDRRKLLALLALLGREAPARIFAGAVGAGEAEILDDLDGLARAGLARLGEGGWATAHDVIGEAVSEGLDRAERGRLHLLLARAVEAEGGDPAEVARHLAGAGDRAAAAAAFADAAGQRLAAFAGDEARDLADAGLDLDPQPAVRAALLRHRAEARGLRGDLAGARDDLRAALPSIPRGAERSRALVHIAELTSALEGYTQANELIDLALAEAGADPAARAEALAMAGFFDVNLNETQRAESRAAEALALFDDIGEPAGMATVVDLRAVIAVFEGRVVEASELFGRAARLYRDCGRLLKVGTMRTMRAWTLLMNDRAAEALQDVDGALELEQSLAQPEGEAGCLWLRSEILVELGRLEEAWADARAGLAISRRLGSWEAIAVNLRGLAACCRASGDLEGAANALREAMEVGAAVPLQLHAASAQLAALLMEGGDLEAAERVATEALRADRGLFQFESRLVLAEIALVRGDPDGERLAAEALALSQASGYLGSRVRKRLAARVPPSRPADAPAPAPRRVRRTFMFTDIVRSTNLVETLGDNAWGHVLRWHDQMLRSLFARYGGEEINRIGDGFFVAFERARDGARCAVEIQQALDSHRRDHGFAPEVRIGLHQAEATRDGDDYQGRGVHEAARIAALAGAGEILMSRSDSSDLDGFHCSEPRTVRLKGFSDAVDVVSVDWQS